MRTRSRLERLLRSRILGPSVDRQIDEELDLHVEMVARELMAAGMEESAARATAAERFRGRAAVAAACGRIARGAERRLRLAVQLEELRQDVAYGTRQLARSPGFTAVALLTLAVGLGAATAIFSVVEGVVLRRFPFAHPERLVFVREHWQDVDGLVSVGNFVDLRAASHSFTALTAMQFTRLNLAGDDRPERLLAVRATSGMFAAFGVPPILGRAFDAGEDQPGHQRVVVLSHGLWTRRFGAEPSVLGRSLRLSGEPYQVVGVMPPGFDPTLTHEDLWLPAAFTPAQQAEHDEHYLTVVGLLRPGVGRAAAQAELTAAMRRIVARHPKGNLGRTAVSVAGLPETLIGDYRQRLLVLLAAVGLVLLIACANVASLLLGRGTARGKELAIRAAIGAGGGRIVRQLLTESLVLAMAAAVLGTALAAAGVRLLVGLAPADVPRIGESRIDAGVLLFTLSAAIACSLLFGTVPALRAARGEPQALLRGRSRGGGGPAGDRLRGSLVLAEVALALTLLVGAGLLIRSALYLERVPAGFVTADVLTARVSLPEAVYPRPAEVERAFGEMVERLAHAPGVRAAAAASAAPLGAGGASNGLLPEGKPMASENLIDATLHLVTPGYCEALRLPLLAGRFFSARDTRSAGRVMIVSRELARRAWGGADPIGKRIGCCELGPGAATVKTVVGLVGDVRSRGPAEPPAPEFYLPIGQAPPDGWNWTQRTMTLVARGPDLRLLANAMRGAVRGVDPALPLSQVRSMDEALQGSLAEARFHTLLLLVLGLLGLLLAAVGIYGVIAYFVGSRTQEIGVRIALGATRERILSLLGRQAAAPLAGGLLLGTGGALAATRLLAGSLHGVTATDPATFICVVLLLVAVGLLAVLIPAARATRVDPTRAIQAP